MPDLSSRSAVITGGLTGQGLAIAHELAQRGANVGLGSYMPKAAGRAGDAAAYPDPKEIATVRSAVETHGTKIFAGHLDVRDVAIVRHFLAEAEVVCGLHDILVNAAGTTAE